MHVSLKSTQQAKGGIAMLGLILTDSREKVQKTSDSFSILVSHTMDDDMLACIFCFPVSYNNEQLLIILILRKRLICDTEQELGRKYIRRWMSMKTAYRIGLALRTSDTPQYWLD